MNNRLQKTDFVTYVETGLELFFDQDNSLIKKLHKFNNNYKTYHKIQNILEKTK